MFGKWFASAYTGSMMGAGAHVFAVWAWCIANADKSGTVEINPPLLATLIGSSEDEILAAIDYLTAPDDRSRSDAEDGRRLVHVAAFTYEIVNHGAYRSMRSAEDRREYMREYMRERRSQKRTGDGSSATISPRVNTCKQPLAKLAHTEAEAEAETEAEAITPRPASGPCDESMGLAQYLYEAIRSHTPDYRASWAPKRLERSLLGWARDLDRLIRLDGADPAEIQRVIDYCHRSAETFERANVQSGAKLRKRWDSLRVKARDAGAKDRTGMQGIDPADAFGDTVFFGGER